MEGETQILSQIKELLNGTSFASQDLGRSGVRTDRGDDKVAGPSSDLQQEPGVSSSTLRQELDSFAERLQNMLRQELQSLQGSWQQKPLRLPKIEGKRKPKAKRAHLGMSPDLADASIDSGDHEWMQRPWYSHFYAGHFSPESGSLTAIGTPKNVQSVASLKHPKLFHRPEVPGAKRTKTPAQGRELSKRSLNACNQSFHSSSPDNSPKSCEMAIGSLEDSPKLRNVALGSPDVEPQSFQVLFHQSPHAINEQDVSDVDGSLLREPLQVEPAPSVSRGTSPRPHSARTPSADPARPDSSATQLGQQTLKLPEESTLLGDHASGCLEDTMKSQASLFQSYSRRGSLTAAPRRAMALPPEIATELSAESRTAKDHVYEFDDATAGTVAERSPSGVHGTQSHGSGGHGTQSHGKRPLGVGLHHLDDETDLDGTTQTAGKTIRKGPTFDFFQRWCPSSVASMVYHESFDYFTGVFVCASAVFVGVRADYSLSHVKEDEPIGFRVASLVFCLAFVLEISLRIWVYRGRFFRLQFGDWDWWNIFDCTVVAGSIFAELLEILDGSTNVFSSLSRGLSYLRIMRLLRVVRIIRIMRFVHLVEELRVLVASVSCTMKSFFWTLVLILLMMYLIGVHIVQLIVDRARTNPAILSPGKPLEVFFGSLGRTLLSLFQAITSGVDWDDLVKPLMDDVSPVFGVTFAIYIAFAVLAMMNVITGVFVESALTNTKQENDVDMMMNMRELFDDIDFSGTGLISWEQFRKMSCKPGKMDMYFKAVDLDPNEAGGLFKLLDLDESGTINVDEFVMGCLRLRGPAKAIDMATLMFDTRKANQRVLQVIEDMHRSMFECFDTLDASTLRPQQLSA
jgi:hypothetical protein